MNTLLITTFDHQECEIKTLCSTHISPLQIRH